MLDIFKNTGLSVKIALLGGSSVLITAVLLLSVVSWQSNQYNRLAQNEVDKLIESDLNHITEGVYNLIKAEHEARRETGTIEPGTMRPQTRQAILGISIGKTGYVYIIGT